MKMNNTLFDSTIVGISTSPNRSAISIVRLSGIRAIEIVNKSFRGKDLLKVKSHTINYGKIVNRDGDIIDEVLVSVFRSPKTYTKEDVVEINCHGGYFVTNIIFEEMIKNGAVIAEAGEFTKRAFLNGRIDLTKAEAVMDIIDAENRNALKFANQGLRGDIKKLIDDKRNKLLDIIALIAVNIDYPEYDDVEEVKANKIKPQVISLQKELEIILKYARDAEKIKNGITTTIVGKPNVGKSSVLNALLKEQRAIVTSIPGTTRDVVEARLNLNGLTLNLIDTAGIRETSDLVEQIGIQKAKEKITKANLILLVLDASNKLSDEDYELINELQDKKYLVIVNKKDLESQVEFDKIKNLTQNHPILSISSFNNKDVNELEKLITSYCLDNEIDADNMTYISNARQIGKIEEALTSLKEALQEIEDHLFIDFIDIPLKEAWNKLGEVIGEVKSDELINELFSKFCLGK